MMGVASPGCVDGTPVFRDRADIPAHLDGGSPDATAALPDQRLLLAGRKRTGLLVGFYEQGCKTWGMDGIDPKFANALCPDDLDRVMAVLEGAFARMPALAEVGIKRWSTALSPIRSTARRWSARSPASATRFASSACGRDLGEGGGHGWLLAQQIVHGEACYDTWVIDPRRFAPAYATSS